MEVRIKLRKNMYIEKIYTVIKNKIQDYQF